MNMNHKILELLYRSFDAMLSKEEETLLSQALSSSAELREEKKIIEATRRVVSEEAERSFKPFFSARVMWRINTESLTQDDFFDSLVWIFRRIALAGGLAVFLLFANSLLSERHLSLDSLMGMPQITLEDSYELDNPIVEEEL